MAYSYRQGQFIPKNPDKYRGDVDNIRYMSSWEKNVHEFFDINPNVLEWSSEEVKIPYYFMLDKKLHTYYPDYWVKYKKANGLIVEEIIEVKPIAQTKPPRKNSKRLLEQQFTYAKNVSKWKAASEWCKVHNMTFRIISENSIFK